MLPFDVATTQMLPASLSVMATTMSLTSASATLAPAQHFRAGLRPH